MSAVDLGDLRRSAGGGAKWSATAAHGDATGTPARRAEPERRDRRLRPTCDPAAAATKSGPIAGERPGRRCGGRSWREDATRQPTGATETGRARQHEDDRSGTGWPRRDPSQHEPPTRSTPDALAEVRRRGAQAISDGDDSVIEGKPDVVRTAITVLLAEGHLLIEDVPGVGKTMLAKTLARSIDCSVRRIQFTPDLLPSDITGVSVFNQDVRDFEFRPGAIFANVVVGDEINRASPKTQSALLESMEEGQVTVDGHDLRPARAVHRDGHPEPDRDGGHLPAARGPARPVHGADLDGLPRRRGRGRHARQPRRRVARWTTCSRSPTPHRSPDGRGGPRRSTPAPPSSSTSSTSSTATRDAARRCGWAPRPAPRLHLLRAARAHAALDGRDHVLPDDVQALVVPGAGAPAHPHGRDPAGPALHRRRAAATCCRPGPRAAPGCRPER